MDPEDDQFELDPDDIGPSVSFWVGVLVTLTGTAVVLLAIRVLFC